MRSLRPVLESREGATPSLPPLRPMKAPDPLRERIRHLHDSIRTETLYVHWVRTSFRAKHGRGGMDSGRTRVPAFAMAADDPLRGSAGPASTDLGAMPRCRRTRPGPMAAGPRRRLRASLPGGAESPPGPPIRTRQRSRRLQRIRVNPGRSQGSRPQLFDHTGIARSSLTCSKPPVWRCRSGCRLRDRRPAFPERGRDPASAGAWFDDVCGRRDEFHPPSSRMRNTAR